MTVAQLFSDAWNEAEKTCEPARFATGVRKVPYAELIAAIEKEDRRFIHQFVRSFHGGEVYIFTNAFDPSTLLKLKNDAYTWGRTQKSQEPKIIGKIPDYRSRRDWHAEDHGPGYSSTYDMYHF